MINQHQKKVLLLALRAGEIMLKSGAETYRVEDTMTRICKACSIENVEVFATTTGIFISLDKGDEDSDTHTFIKRIRGWGHDLEKISKINQFSRRFTTTDLTVDEGLEMIEEIDATKKFSVPLQILGGALVAALFTMLFGGIWADFPGALVIGGILYGLVLILDKIQMNAFIRNFCATSLATILVLLGHEAEAISQIDPVIIGSLMILVPGVAITNAVRDSLSGDMVSAAARAMEAVLTAVSIAAGAGFVITLWVSFGGVV